MTSRLAQNSVVISGSSSGTATIAVPAAAGTLTFTLPTANGTAIVSNASGNIQFNSGYGTTATAYGCRAWVNFVGSAGSNIRGSGNVSSVTYNAAGDYTVNFTTALVDANYATAVTSDGNLGANQSITAGLYAGGAYSTAAVRVLVFLNGSGGFDRNIISVIIIR
jgi:hypothetical protein